MHWFSVIFLNIAKELFYRRQSGSILNHFNVIGPKVTEFGEAITRFKVDQFS